MSQTITNFCDVCKVGIDKSRVGSLHTVWAPVDAQYANFYFNGRPLISLSHVDLCSAGCFEVWCAWQVSKVKLAFAEYEKNKVEAF